MISAASMHSGTNTLGVPTAAFAPPPGTRLRCDLPALALRPYVAAYMIYGFLSAGPAVNWFLPANPVISVLVGANSVEIMTLEDKFAASGAVLIGPTTRAYRAVFKGGFVINVELTSLGWMRLTGRSAHAFADRVMSLSDVLGSTWALELSSALKLVTNEREIPHVLDEYLSRMLRHRVTREAESIAAVLMETGATGVAEAAAQLDLSPRQLLQITRSVFGMSPKLVMRRARLLRAVEDLLLAREERVSVDDLSGYFDASHFFKDANDFLGTTPRRFLNEETLLLRAALVARRAVTGHAIHALQRGS